MPPSESSLRYLKRLFLSKDEKCNIEFAIVLLFINLYVVSYLLKKYNRSFNDG